MTLLAIPPRLDQLNGIHSQGRASLDPVAGSTSQEHRPGRECVGLDRLESDSALNLRERSLAGTQEDRDVVEAVFVDQAGGCQGRGEDEAPDAYRPAAGLRFEPCDFGDRIAAYQSRVPFDSFERR